MAERERPQPDKRLGDADLLLDRDHPAALCTTKWKSAPLSSSSATVSGGAHGLGLQHPAGGHPGHHQRVSVLIAAQRAGPVPVQVQRPGAPCRPATGTRTPPARPPAAPPGRTPATGGSPDPPGRARPPPCPAGRHPRTGPSPRVYCRSSIRWLASSLVHNDPRGISPDISVDTAPVTPAIPGHTRTGPGRRPPLPRRTTPQIRPSLPPGIVSDTTPDRHPAHHAPPHHDRPPAASFTRGNQTIRQEPGSTASRTQVLITDATPPATPGGTGPPPGYRPERADQIGMICARSADRDVYQTPDKYSAIRSSAGHCSDHA